MFLRLELPADESQSIEKKLDEFVMSVDYREGVTQSTHDVNENNNAQNMLLHEQAERDIQTSVGAVQQAAIDSAVQPSAVITAATAVIPVAADQTETERDDCSEAEADNWQIEGWNVTELQRSCPNFKFIMEYLEQGLLPQDNDAAARKVIFQAERYVLIDGKLLHLQLPWNKKQQQQQLINRLAVPSALRAEVLTHYHEKKFHVGPEKLYLTIRQNFFWPNLYIDVYDWVKNCEACQIGKVLAKKQAPLRSLPVPGLFEVWHADFLQLNNCNGYNYVLVSVDNFSLFSILLPAKTTTATETARLMYDNLFTLYTCKAILTDRGTSFRAKVVKELCRLMNIKQIFTSARHPQTNSRCESYNRNILNAHCEGRTDWPALLPSIAHAYRTSVVKNLGYSPYQIVFGRQPHMPLDGLLGLQDDEVPSDMSLYMKGMSERLAVLRKLVKENQLAAHARTAVQYNRKVVDKCSQFRIGMRVWMYSPQVSKQKHAHKILPRWRGPFLIVGENHDYHTFKLQDCKTQKLWKSWVHVNRLQMVNNERDRFYQTDGNNHAANNHAASTEASAAVGREGEREHTKADAVQPAGRDSDVTLQRLVNTDVSESVAAIS